MWGAGLMAAGLHACPGMVYYANLVLGGCFLSEPPALGLVERFVVLWGGLQGSRGPASRMPLVPAALSDVSPSLPRFLCSPGMRLSSSICIASCVHALGE